MADPLDVLAARLRDRLLHDTAELDVTGDGELDVQIRALVDRDASMLGPDARADLVRRVAERCIGLGPLEPLLADPHVDEVVVNGAGDRGRVWVERGGRLEATDVGFGSEAELRHAIERILAPLGRRVDESEPLCDARLSDRTVCVRQSLNGRDERSEGGGPSRCQCRNGRRRSDRKIWFRLPWPPVRG